MRVLHISYHKSWRGGEQQISYLIGELHKLGCQQWIYCSESNALEDFCKEKGLSYYTFPNNLLSKFKNVKKLNYICNKHAIELLHVHDSMSHMMAYMAGISGNDIPIILSRHIDSPVRNSIISRKKYNYRGIKKIICISENIKRTLEPDILDKSKLTTIYDGIDLDKFSQVVDTGILRKQYKIAGTTKIIGNISALTLAKDYFTFIDTAEILIHKKLDVRFIIVGEGVVKKKLEEYIKNKDLADYFVFTGFRKDVPQILAEFDVFLFTSEKEGLGNSVLDAFAARVPVVSTNTGGIPEMIDHQVSGLLADVKDSTKLAEHVISILQDDKLKQRLVNNASEKVKQFSMQIMAEKIYDLYQEVYDKSVEERNEKGEQPYSQY